MSTRIQSLPICIIGSGLSAVSVAKGLEKTDQKVILIDAGLDLSDNTSKKISKLGEIPAWQWKDEDPDVLRKGVRSSASGVKEKLQYGSNYSSRQLESFPIERTGTKFYSSFAKGGLSNIWGAGLLPMHTADMTDWPILHTELVPHYEAVLKFMPLSGQHDSLEKLLPLYCKPTGHSLSRQTTSVLARMNKHRHTLNNRGIYFGGSRLAARYHDPNNAFDCQYCGMCMYGCPYGILYSAKDTLKELLQNTKYSYLSNYTVTHFEEYANSIKIYGVDKAGRQLEPIEAARIILAAGAPATTKIVLSSLGIYGKSIDMLTSDQFYLPLIALSGQRDIRHEALHTMCQSFWVMQNPQISPHLVHFSLYSYNDLYEQAFKNILGKVLPLGSGDLPLPLSRLFFAFCFLHSSESGKLTATLNNNRDNSLVIQGHINSRSKAVFGNALKELRKIARLTGLFPAPFYKGERLPGAGNHFGGSFPMKETPSGLQTNIQGRLHGLRRVYLADSSVFPSITATTVSLSVMANAHRIGRIVANLEE